jgi:enoyl-CoA hydratase/carnithine racemase
LKYLGPKADLENGPYLEAELEDAVLSFSLNRPQLGSATNEVNSAALSSLLKAISEDEAVRVVVLRCHGAEISLQAIRVLGQLPQPVIAMVQGTCRNSVLEMIKACDIVIAADETDFGTEVSPAQRNELVSQFVSAGELESQTMALARDLAGKDPLALRFTKQTLHQVPDIAWDKVLAFTTAKQNELKALQAGRPSARAQAVESFLAGKSKPGAGI